jgi:uncharacterized protein
MKEKHISIESHVMIKGTLSFPESMEGKAPAILIIPGTGTVDRNGKVNAKVDLKIYRQLAVLLTSLGFVTLRYDKRGVGESEGDYYKTGLWDLVDDAIAAIQFLKRLPEVDPKRVLVVGHSEGSTLGTAVAAREPLAGLVLLAGAVERLTEALVRQRQIARMDILNGKGFQASLLRLLGLHNKIETQAQKLNEKVLNSTEDTIRQGFAKLNAKWFREHYAYNVREDLKKVTCPVLAITGNRDIQADPEAIKNLPLYVNVPNTKYFVIENMNHSLKYQANMSSMFTAKKDMLADSDSPFHPELVEVLEKWLSAYVQEKEFS